MSQETIRTQFARQQAIDRYTEQIVNTAEETLKQARLGQLNESLGNSQLSNLLGVALETNSVAVIRNWVQYQMGRRETLQAWKNTGLGDEVIKAIEKLGGYARDAEAFRLNQGAKQEPEDFLAMHVAMIRLYAGYLKRWYIATGGKK